MTTGFRSCEGLFAFSLLYYSVQYIISHSINSNCRLHHKGEGLNSEITRYVFAAEYTEASSTVRLA